METKNECEKAPVVKTALETAEALIETAALYLETVNRSQLIVKLSFITFYACNKTQMSIRR